MTTDWPDSNPFWRDKRVIVTGGAGFLGSFVVEKLRERRAAEIIVPDAKTGRSKMPKTLTIKIPDELEQQLEEQATDRNITLEEVVIEWLDKMVGPTSPVEDDPIAPLIGTLSLEAHDIAEHHDLYLAESLQQELRRAA